MEKLELLIPAGRTHTLNCPEGTRALVKTGDMLPKSDKEPSVLVLSASEQSIVFAPLKAGTFEISNICKNDDGVVIRVEAPNPQQIQQQVVPVNPFSIKYPTWILVAPLIGLILLALLGAGIYKFSQKRKLLKKASVVQRKLTALERMEEFLKKIEKEKLLTSKDSKDIQKVYAEATVRLRNLIQEAFEFHNPGATTSEFVGEFKSRIPKKANLLNPSQIAQIESLFMQSKQVTYAQDLPEDLIRQAFLKTLKDIFQVFKIKAQTQTQGAAKK